MTQEEKESKTVKIPVKAEVEKPKEEKFPATLKFFAVTEAGKQIRVLPALIDVRYMKDEEVWNLTLENLLSGGIKVPDIEPWNQIGKFADHFFLMIQTRSDWGGAVNADKLFELDSVRALVEDMEESLNAGTFRIDLDRGKFAPPRFQVAVPEKPKVEPTKQDSDPDSVVAGSSWAV